MDTFVSLSRGRAILYRSFIISLAALIVGAAIVGFTASAANYSALLSGSVNWTATTSGGVSAVWSCSPSTSGDVCGVYPGDGISPFVDNANISTSGGTATISVSSSIPRALTLNDNSFNGATVNVTGTLPLTGASAVTGATGPNVLSINGGTVSNGGTLTISGGTSRLDLLGGALTGAGTTTIASAGTLNITGAQGPMSINQQQVSNGANASFSATNTLSLSNGVNFVNGSGATFNANGSGTIAGGAGTVLFKNAGSLDKSIGGPFTLGVPFENTSTAALSSSGLTYNLTGGSGPAGHSNATWDLGSGGTMTFGGNHVFNNAQTFIGTGTINANGGFTINTTPTTMPLPAGVNMVNAGAIDFGSTTHNVSVGGNYSQAAVGTLQVKLGPTNGVSDAVNAIGSATLGGTLVATLATGYVPADGDAFIVVTGSSVLGTFTYTPLAYSNGFFQIFYNATSVVLVAVPQADILVTKTGPASVLDAQNATYTVTVTNNGPASASNVIISDSFSNGTFVSAAPSTGSCSGTGPITCTIPTLSTGTSATIIVVLKASAPGTLTNTASLSSSTPADPNSTNNTATATTTVTPVADLSLTKTGPPTVVAGAPMSYTLTVTNAGPDPATTATVTDTLPAGLSGVTAAGTGWTCSIAGTTVTCTATNLAMGAAPPITISGNAPAAGGPIVNNATVSESGSVDSNNGNNNASVTTTVTASADIGITKTGPATAVAGQSITYSYAVTNNGPSNVINVTVNDTPGTGLTLVSSTAPCSTGFPCTIATLNSGSTVTFTATFVVSPTATGSVSNTATASASGVTDANPGNDSATAVTAVTVNSDVAIAKTGPASAFAGQTITYTINVINNGPSTATGVVVSDPTPAGTTAGPVSGSCAAFPCSIASLAPGAGASINATYTINPTTTAPVINSASVTSTSPDSNGGNNTATVTTTVTPEADLAISKTGPSTIPASGQITFIIVVRNLGPSTANNVIVNDSPGPGLTFLANSGGCTTPFPCAFATLASGATITIQSTFKVAAGVANVTNTADVTSSTSDPNGGNNSATASASAGAANTCPSGPLSQFSPFSGQQDVPTSGTMQWTNVGATSYQVYYGPAGTGCTTLVATVNGTSFNYSGLTPNTDYESRIVAVESSCPSITSQCIRWRTVSGGCNLAAPVLQSPAAGTTVGGTTTLTWGSVPGATSYHVVVIVNGVTQVDTTTPDTSLDVTIPNGTASWSVTAIGGGCTSPTSTGSFNICGPPPAPVVGVVGAPTSGNAYSVLVVVPSAGAVSYDFQEATDASFGSVTTQNTNATSLLYSHTTSVAEVFFYRVRAIGACTNSAGPFSKPVRVVIVPAVQDLRNPKVNVPAGNQGLVVIQVQIPGDSVKENFTATGDRPWIVAINPSSGILPPEGIVLNVTIDPAQLPNGTFTATVIVTTSPINGNSRIVTNGSKKSVPVSINLVTPVIPVNPDAPTADSIFIPAVGHLAGLNSQWRSDIRIYNASPQTLQYLLNFTPQGSTDVKRTTITTASGDTTALDDIIHNWFGVGEVGDSSTGVLEIRPMTTDGSTKPPAGSAFTTVASSRTFDTTGDGTVGQFIPPVKFTNFIGAGSRLSMQQLAQSTAYRTNFGLVEGSGAPVSLLLSMFNSAGTKLFDLPVNLAAGEQKLLNGLLAQQGVTSLSDGRMEVKVAGGDGKVTAYASVIDNASLDPQLVPGQTLTNTSSKLYVVPGVADLNNGVAAWRTDMRIYNSGNAPSTMDVVFYPQDNASLPFFATVTVNPGEVKVLDSVVQSLFATNNVGGMVQLTTATDSQLVVTARTYNQTANGTLGQFIKAATAAEGITTQTKGLNILQVEDSPRFRTNLGLAEMTGKPATVEVSVILPDSKVTPSIQVPLAANEFRQFSVAQFGLGNIYNARVSVKVVDGAGSVTAYGSVIDQVTTDPTYVQAQ